MRDDKYVVFKKSDFETLLKRLASIGSIIEDELTSFPDIQLDDAVVIRRRDIFAPPALDAYSFAILTSLEGLKEITLGIPYSPDVEKINKRAVKLQEISDYFHEQAKAAWLTHRKLPD